MLFRNRFVLLLALAALLAFVSLSLQFCECGWAGGSWRQGGVLLSEIEGPMGRKHIGPKAFVLSVNSEVSDNPIFLLSALVVCGCDSVPVRNKGNH